MKKGFKVVGIILGVIVLMIGFVGYYGWKKTQKFSVAQEQANYIIENLDNPIIIEKFPAKYFPKEQVEPIIAGLKEKCDWKNRDGKFVDFYTEKNIGGIDQTAFIYEYYMKCDSMRFILSFNTEKEPELMGLRFEPLETKNPKILFPEKQLKNRK